MNFAFLNHVCFDYWIEIVNCSVSLWTLQTATYTTSSAFFSFIYHFICDIKRNKIYVNEFGNTVLTFFSFTLCSGKTVDRFKYLQAWLSMMGIYNPPFKAIVFVVSFIIEPRCIYLAELFAPYRTVESKLLPAHYSQLSFSLLLPKTHKLRYNCVFFKNLSCLSRPG